MNQQRIIIEEGKHHFGFDIYILRRDPSGTYQTKYHDGFLAKEEKLEINALNTEPTFRMDKETFQNLVNEIHHKGFKPAEGKFIEGKLEATEKHLEDMRKLVFHDMELKNKTFFTTDSIIKKH